MKADHSSVAELRRVASFISFMGLDNDIMQAIIDNPEAREPARQALLDSLLTRDVRFLMMVFDHLDPSISDAYRWAKKIGVKEFLAPLELREREVLQFLHGLEGHHQLSFEETIISTGLPVSRLQLIEAQALAKLRHPEYDLIDGLNHGGVLHGPQRDILAQG